MRFPDGREAEASLITPSPQREVPVSYRGDLRGVELWPSATASGLECWADYVEEEFQAEVTVRASGLFDFRAE